MMVAYGPIGKDNQDTIVTVAGVIKNKGAPTVLDKWSLEIEFPDGKRIRGQIPLAPRAIDTYTIARPNGQNPMDFQGSKWWPLTTRTQPIVTGGGGEGWMNALFSNQSAQEVHDKQAKVILVYSDINGKQWSLEYSLKGENAKILNMTDIPGVKTVQ